MALIIANEVRSSKNSREWDRQLIMELGQGGEVKDRSVMIIVLGIVAHFCRQGHQQWHKRQSCFSFDTSLVELGGNTYKRYFPLFGLKTEFCNHVDMSVVSFIHICLCASTQNSGPFFAIYNVFLIEYSAGEKIRHISCVLL